MLLTFLEERESREPDEPSYVQLQVEGELTEILIFLSSVTALKVNVGPLQFDSYDCKSLKAENDALKQTIREYQLVDEAVQSSRNDELSYGLTKPLKKVKNGRYEIPVPFEQEKLPKLPDNYENALYRSMSLCKTMLRNSTLKQTLVDIFAELISEKWIEPVKCQELETPFSGICHFLLQRQQNLRLCVYLSCN